MLLLVGVEGLEVAQAAAVLSIRPDAARQRLARARAALAEALDEADSGRRRDRAAASTGRKATLMTTPDPLLERLRQLPRPAPDDIAAARTLARAEAAFVSARNAPRARLVGASVPAALALWAALYVWGAVGELGRLFPATPAKPAVAVNHRGPSVQMAAQFMLNAISKREHEDDGDDDDRAALPRHLARDFTFERGASLLRRVF